MTLLTQGQVSEVKRTLDGCSDGRPLNSDRKSEAKASQLKQQGNQHFKMKRRKQALWCYSEVAIFLVELLVCNYNQLLNDQSIVK